jgi:hypothetical protein
MPADQLRNLLIERVQHNCRLVDFHVQEESLLTPSQLELTMDDTYKAVMTSMAHRLSESEPEGRNALPHSSRNMDEEDRCDGVVLVTGSAFIMSEARAVCVSIDEPRDGNILSELTGELSKHPDKNVIGRDSQV